VSRATVEARPVRPFKRALVGRPMATGELEETLLPKTLALPIFASDPLSSVAYATESALVVLVAASAAAAYLVFPISLAIAALLAIVVASYRQTVREYETSGGAYIVAKDCRASSERPLSSPTTCSRSRSRSPPASLR
jgi:hypothetical protein